MCMLQTLIRTNPVRYREVSLLKACGNYLSQAPPPPPPPPKHQTCPAADGIKRYENPCLDLFYNLLPQKPETFVRLNRLLPPAWSYDPLTSLNIIRNWDGQSIGIGEEDTEEEAFFNGLCWLHRNHPKTLASNLPYIVGTESHYYAFVRILFEVLDLKLALPFGDHELEHFRKAIQGDLHFSILHDRVSDLFAESLKFDIQNLIKYDHDDEDQEEVLEVTNAVEHIEDAPLVLESVAKRVFPASTSIEDAVERLRKEVLDPLNKVFDNYGCDTNEWGYKLVTREWPYYRHEKYLKEVKKSLDKMVPDALLPNQIVAFVHHQDLRQVVELQWKAMVDDLKKKYKERMQGILSNSLAVMSRDLFSSRLTTCMELVVSLTILMSELSEEDAWKGKVIPSIPKPRLLLIQGDDLKSKCDFLSKDMIADYSGPTDFKKVFELILQEAVDRSLKPEQMIKRVHVFNLDNGFEWTSGGYWQAQDYEAMQSKYNNHGYYMPHIVFWRLGDHLEPVQHSPDQRGVATISGFRYGRSRPVEANFVKLFLENDGVMSPQRVMEANLCHHYYDHSPLAVVD